MSFGFQIYSGTTGALVESISSDTPPGVLIETFTYTWSLTPLVKSYTNFPGKSLFPILNSLSVFGSSVDIAIDNTNKTITITGTGTLTGRNNAIIVVLGI